MSALPAPPAGALHGSAFWQLAHYTSARLTGHSDADSFLKHVERDIDLAISRGILVDRNDALPHVGHLMSGPALSWYNLYGTSFKTWAAFADEVRRKFRRRRAVGPGISSLFGLRRRSGETNLNFGFRVAKAIDDLPAEDRPSLKMQKEFLITGQRSEKFKQKIVQMRIPVNGARYQWDAPQVSFDDLHNHIADVFDLDSNSAADDGSTADDESDTEPAPPKAKSKTKTRSAAAAPTTDDDLAVDDLAAHLSRTLRISTGKAHEMIAAYKNPSSPALYVTERSSPAAGRGPRPDSSVQEGNDSSADECYAIFNDKPVHVFSSGKPRRPCRNCGSSSHVMSTCPTVKCYGCDEVGHTRNICDKVPRRPKAQACQLCSATDHLAKACPQLRQFLAAQGSAAPAAPDAAAAGSSFPQRG
jgi:hypothetical protein